MDILWQIQIVDQMIRETPDATIRDFLELVDELNSIEEVNDKPAAIMKTVSRHLKVIDEKYK